MYGDGVNEGSIRAGSACPILFDLVVSAGSALALLAVFEVTLPMLRQRRGRAQTGLTQPVRRDPLTGLANRSWFREYLLQGIAPAPRMGRGFAVLRLDLEGFKLVNDLRGHETGDRLLELAADRLRSAVPPGSMVARLEGGEFVILFRPSEKPDDTARLARHLLTRLTEPYEIGGQQLGTGASIGIALCPADGRTPDGLLRNAGAALHQAKAQGRSVFHFFEPSMQAGMQKRRALEQDLQEALAQQQFRLEYQPVRDTRTHALMAFEALLRWQHPQSGDISPKMFIPVAEQSGLIVPLGRWVLETACAEAMKWPASVRVAVNLSPVQFLEPALPGQIIDILRHAGLAPERLTLEITEGMLIANSDRARAIMQELRSRGIRFALDDFGTGYAGLNYLRHFPFNTLKIDRSYVAQVAEDEQSRSVLQAMIMLARALKLEVIAEGVETEAQLLALQRLGCQSVQGYLLGRPMPAVEVQRLLGPVCPASLQVTPHVILAVDDDPAVRKLVVDVLQRAGFQVLEAGGGEEALALLERAAPVDLLFTDIRMPEMDGFQLAEAAQKHRPGLKVLFTTGYTVQEPSPDMTILQKPYSVNELIAALHKALGTGPMPVAGLAQDVLPDAVGYHWRSCRPRSCL